MSYLPNSKTPWTEVASVIECLHNWDFFKECLLAEIECKSKDNPDFFRTSIQLFPDFDPFPENLVCLNFVPYQKGSPNIHIKAGRTSC